MEQTSADKDSESPTGQADNGQLFSIIRTKSADRLDKEKNQDRKTSERIFWKIWTKTRQGQDADSVVRRRLEWSSMHPVASFFDYDKNKFSVSTMQAI